MISKRIGRPESCLLFTQSFVHSHLEGYADEEKRSTFIDFEAKMKEEMGDNEINPVLGFGDRILQETNEKENSCPKAFGNDESKGGLESSEKKFWCEIQSPVETDDTSEVLIGECSESSSILKESKMTEKNMFQSIHQSDKKTNEENGKFKTNIEVEFVYQAQNENSDPSWEENTLVFSKIQESKSLDASSKKGQINMKSPKNRASRKQKAAKSELGFVPQCAQNIIETHEETIGSRRKYTRLELEAFRFINSEWQKNRWSAIYNRLESTIVRELKEMALPKNQKQGSKHVDDKQRKKNREAFSTKVDNYDATDSFDPSVCCHVDAEKNCTIVEEPWEEDENSSDEYDCIQKAVFLVEGEPNFDSGPPEDGFEYLRRVRWEAAQIPKVKVAKIHVRKTAGNQTAYMPKIPDIPKCPEHLLPSKRWEEDFLADFSELRLLLSRLESSEDNIYTKQTDIHTFKDSDAEYTSVADRLHSFPTVPKILSMDAVSRSSLLSKHINSFESKPTLCRYDCLWLFSLCAAVDIPLNAEMCASLRCLFRKCSTLRAEKSQSDEEVVMLNILATIAGKYFGQSEHI